MSAHILILALGPVQDFIAQARRTRDLWFGSHVLSEVSKAAAKALTEHQDGVVLVFPALSTGGRDLEPEDEVRRSSDAADDMPYSVANKIVAELADGVDPAVAAEAARRAARGRLYDWGQQILNRERTLVAREALAGADEQLRTLLEVRAVWVPIDPVGYAEARRRAEAALAARKTLHAFRPWSAQRGGVFKSSLDGARETVLRDGRRTDKAWQRYRIGRREELDAIGLLKRTGGRTDQFVPVPTVGLAAWIERARDTAPDELAALAGACDEHDFQRVDARRPWLAAFRYDAQVLLPERWGPYFHDQDRPTDSSARDRVDAKARRFGETRVMPLLRAVGEPSPYVVCLVADGDHMGRAIDALAAHGPHRHRDLSRALARFARAAQAVVEREHRGVLVYAGGDDVLAFVCVQDALSCADRLRRRFAEIVADATDSDAIAPTLSVGLGVGHVMQSLGHLLGLGRAAESLAKRGTPPGFHDARDALAVVFERHSGATRRWRGRWRDEPLARLRCDVELLMDERLSRSKIHEIDALLARAARGEDETAAGAPGSSERVDAAEAAADGRVLAGEVRRVLARTESAEGAALTPADVGLDLGHPGDPALARAVRDWVSRMHIALHLARAHRAAPVAWPRGDAS